MRLTLATLALLAGLLFANLALAHSFSVAMLLPEGGRAAPDALATRAYVAVRLIDLAVRAQGGVSDKAALAASVTQY